MNREEKKKDTRRKIMEAAYELFAEHGYEATTVVNITERAGVAKGTFFNYFETKDDVLCELQMFWAAEEIRKLKDRPGPLEPRVKILVTELATRMPFTRSLTRAVLQSALGSPRSLDIQKEQIAEMKEVIIPIVALGQERGEFSSKLPPELIAQFAVQTYYGVLMGWAMEQGEDHLGIQMAMAFDVLFAGIRNEGGAK